MGIVATPVFLQNGGQNITAQFLRMGTKNDRDVIIIRNGAEFVRLEDGGGVEKIDLTDRLLKNIKKVDNISPVVKNGVSATKRIGASADTVLMTPNFWIPFVDGVGVTFLIPCYSVT
jgi:hypothetical protein